MVSLLFVVALETVAGVGNLQIHRELTENSRRMYVEFIGELTENLSDNQRRPTEN
jgi:hypothetical protein